MDCRLICRAPCAAAEHHPLNQSQSWITPLLGNNGGQVYNTGCFCFISELIPLLSGLSLHLFNVCLPFLPPAHGLAALLFVSRYNPTPLPRPSCFVHLALSSTVFLKCKKYWWVVVLPNERLNITIAHRPCCGLLPHLVHKVWIVTLLAWQHTGQGSLISHNRFCACVPGKSTRGWKYSRDEQRMWGKKESFLFYLS